MEQEKSTLKTSLLKTNGETQIPVEKLEITQNENNQNVPTSAAPKRKIKLNTRSVQIVAYLVFLIASSSGLLMCALWPLCDSLGGSEIQLGKKSFSITLFL